MSSTGFKESDAKATVRRLIRKSAEELGRRNLSYLGMPGQFAGDLEVMAPLVDSVVAVEKQKDALAEMRRAVCALPLRSKSFFFGDVWDYLKDEYPSSSVMADVCFLDFYGGGLSDEDPFRAEIQGLRSYFAKHASQPNRSYVFAWTFMPRDKGRQLYESTLAKLIGDQALLGKLSSATRSDARSIAIRLLLWQCLREHEMLARVVQHAVYKKVMNVIIMQYSLGIDSDCVAQLEPADALLRAPIWEYDLGGARPKRRMLDLLQNT